MSIRSLALHSSRARRRSFAGARRGFGALRRRDAHARRTVRQIRKNAHLTKRHFHLEKVREAEWLMSEVTRQVLSRRDNHDFSTFGLYELDLFAKRLHMMKRVLYYSPIKGSSYIVRKLRPLFDHFDAETEIEHKFYRLYDRFELGQASTECTCRGCQIRSKTAQNLQCDCAPTNPLVDRMTKRELNDGMCCDACYHIYHEFNCGCGECQDEAGLHKANTFWSKLHAKASVLLRAFC